jgi:hypothetical protein
VQQFVSNHEILKAWLLFVQILGKGDCQIVTVDHSAGEPHSPSPWLKHPVPSGKRQRGPLAKKFNLVKEVMIADLRSGERDPNKMREKEWPPVS